MLNILRCEKFHPHLGVVWDRYLSGRAIGHGKWMEKHGLAGVKELTTYGRSGSMDRIRGE